MSRPKHKIPIMRRREALALATAVATKGWKEHEPTASMVEYWSKAVPSGELNITESIGWLSGYDLQHIDTSGRITQLGSSRGTLNDAKVKAVLEASARGFAIVNPRAEDEHWHVDITRGQMSRGDAGPWHFAILKGKRGDQLVYAGSGFVTALDAAKRVKKTFEQQGGSYPPRGYLVIKGPTEAKQYLHAPARKNGDGARALPNRGKPTKKWAAGAVKRPGKLGGEGFIHKPVAQQQQILRQCVKRYGYRSCLGSVMFIHNVSRDASTKARMRQLQSWLSGAYGPKHKCTCRKNPDDGSWEAVPILIGELHIHIGKMKLTSQQLSVLQIETT